MSSSASTAPRSASVTSTSSAPCVSPRRAMLAASSRAAWERASGESCTPVEVIAEEHVGVLEPALLVEQGAQAPRGALVGLGAQITRADGPRQLLDRQLLLPVALVLLGEVEQGLHLSRGGSTASKARESASSASAPTARSASSISASSSEARLTAWMSSTASSRRIPQGGGDPTGQTEQRRPHAGVGLVGGGAHARHPAQRRPARLGAVADQRRHQIGEREVLVDVAVGAHGLDQGAEGGNPSPRLPTPSRAMATAARAPSGPSSLEREALTARS